MFWFRGRRVGKLIYVWNAKNQGTQCWEVEEKFTPLAYDVDIYMINFRSNETKRNMRPSKVSLYPGHVFIGDHVLEIDIRI